MYLFHSVVEWRGYPALYRFSVPGSIAYYFLPFILLSKLERIIIMLYLK